MAVIGKLSARKVQTAKPGKYGDGGGLWLTVLPSGARFWTYRFRFQGRAREMGLGPEHTVSLAEAREVARECRRQVRAGTDPIEQRRKERTEARGVTFAEAAELYIAAHQGTWKNAKHRWQWRQTLEAHVLPRIGERGVGSIETGDVMAIVEPLWRAKPETASRIRGRIEVILDYAAARGWRTGDNVARWKGHLENLLPERTKVAKVKHHAALPWPEVPRFMAELGEIGGVVAQALMFTVITAARTGETIGATWAEIDLAARVWTVPAERMKAGKEHRVPLSDAALEILGEMVKLRRRDSDPVFPNPRHAAISNMAMAMLLKRMGRGDITVHGFRSTFRDWIAEATSYDHTVAEQALAHAIASSVERAYRRGDLFEKRRRLMDDWAAYCAGRTAIGGDVVPIGSARA